MNHTSSSARFVANNRLPAGGREPLLVRVAGAGGAMRDTLPRYAEYNRASERFRYVFEVNDPAVGKAMVLARDARAYDLQVTPHERTIQQAEREASLPNAPRILHIDDAGAMVEALDLIEPTKQPVLGLGVILGPTDRLATFFFALEPGRPEQFGPVRAFLSVIARFQAPGGGGKVLGDGARAERRLLRPIIRAWMAARVHEALPRMASGLPLESPPLVTSADGLSTTPVFVQEGRSFSDPRALAEAVAARPDWRVRLGAPITIAEVVDDGLRFHRVRRRVLDRGITVQGSTSVLSEAERRAEAERKAAEEALSRALSRAERETVNDLAPLLMTD